MMCRESTGVDHVTGDYGSLKLVLNTNSANKFKFKNYGYGYDKYILVKNIKYL